MFIPVSYETGIFHSKNNSISRYVILIWKREYQRKESFFIIQAILMSIFFYYNIFS